MIPRFNIKTGRKKKRNKKEKKSPTLYQPLGAKQALLLHYNGNAEKKKEERIKRI